jgi:hypothetical protein
MEMVPGAAEKNTEQIFWGRLDPEAAGCGDFLSHKNDGSHRWSQPFLRMREREGALLEMAKKVTKPPIPRVVLGDSTTGKAACACPRGQSASSVAGRRRSRVHEEAGSYFTAAVTSRSGINSCGVVHDRQERGPSFLGFHR